MYLPKSLLDHVFLLSPVASANERHGDGDLLEVRLDVLHGHLHGLVDRSADANLFHQYRPPRNVGHEMQQPARYNSFRCTAVDGEGSASRAGWRIRRPNTHQYRHVLHSSAWRRVAGRSRLILLQF